VALGPFLVLDLDLLPHNRPLYLLTVSSQTSVIKATAEALRIFVVSRKMTTLVHVFLVQHLLLPILVSEFVKSPARCRDGPAENSASTPRPDAGVKSLTSPYMLVLGHFGARAAGASIFSVVGPSELLPFTGCLSAIVNHSIEMEEENL
jgi:hypothetical protein